MSKLWAVLACFVALINCGPIYADQYKDRGDALVVYSASWCGPCQRLKPKLIRLKSLGYRVEIRDIDKLKPGDYKPKMVPAIYFFDGKKCLWDLGINSESSLADIRHRLRDPVKR